MDILTILIQGLLEPLSKFLVGLLNWDIVYIVLATLILTQSVKVLLQLFIHNIPGPVILFVLAPLVGIAVAYRTWSYDDQVPWYIVGVAASGLASLGYWLLIQKFGTKFETGRNFQAFINARPMSTSEVPKP